MSDESNSKTLLENEMWLQEAIENEHIIYQRYSTFENTESIGHGAMGEVYKATSSWFQKTIALKKFKISSKFTINEIINEIKLHRRVDDLHDNILRFHGVTTLACWNNDINIRPTINQVIIELNDIKINEINEFNIVNASQEHIILNQPLVSYISTIDKNDNAIPEKLQENKLDNKFRIKNIANIREGILKDLTEEFVNQLYFNRNLDKPFEIFKPDWLKEFINKKNIDSKNLLEKMLKYEQNNSYFTSYIGYFYQNGIGTEMDNHKSLEFYHQVASMNFKSEMKNNSLEIINQSIGQYLLAIFYRLGTIVAVDLEKMFEWGIKSARLGNSFAQVNIGTCYKIGYCTAKDDKQAFEWFLKSAESENIDSQYKVAICFRDGKGTKKSINKAIEWLQKSLDNGNDAARKPLRNLKWKKKFNVCKIN
ncbi:19319_t:CDS:2 [Funneliformis geosporum]|uniref:19319_t:CDS:1 n=1 Tax=Funneliformis geosporum TaxID=1117311 RepID=A0A9W4WME4_9GLOM|nr:19319_t:CDS:2 [Funneliformis geosporum]